MVQVHISRDQGHLEEALKQILKVRSLLPANVLVRVLAHVANLHGLILIDMKLYQDALLVSVEELDCARRTDGENHPMFAACCHNVAYLHMKLKQVDRAIEYAAKCLAIYAKVLGPSHPDTQEARLSLKLYQKALANPVVKNGLASKSDRACNYLDCKNVEKCMQKCLSCEAHYLCKEHEKHINAHVSECEKFPDALPEEKKLTKIVKCRRCRKKTELMKCSVCESVWYCGAACQKQDWRRHKVFCGKK